MFDKIASTEAKYEELMASLGTAQVQSDANEYRKQAKALAEIEPLVQKYREYKAVVAEIASAEELIKGGDPEMRDLALEELNDLNVRKERLSDELKLLLVPKDPERRAQRHARDPRRHRRRRGGAVRRRSVSLLHALRRAPALEDRADVAQRGRPRRHQGRGRQHRGPRRLQPA